MERLTEKKSFLSYNSMQQVNVVKINNEEEFKVETMNDLYLVGSAIDKLAEYEELEEQGLLYRKIFFIGNYCHKPSDCPLICEDCFDNYLEVKNRVVEINRIHIYGEIGKTVFLTEEEAKQELAKMEK